MYRNNDMKAQSGFTLVEIMIVVAIIGIVLAMVTLNFTQLNEKYTVESNTKEIYSILMRARNNASTTNTPRVVLLAANQVQTGPDTDGDNNINGTAVTTNYPRFTINFDAARNPVVFDRRGLANNSQTISIEGFSGGTTPAMDCIEVAFTRITIGKLTGGNCVPR